MSQKILWDEDEALILLDALLQVLSGTLARKDAVALVSRKLRMRAIYKGFVIDNIFRNQNGIRLQMSVMEYAYTGGMRGLRQHKVPKVFQDVVSLYENDCPAYKKRLAEVEAVVALANNRCDESADGLFQIDFNCIEDMAHTSPQTLEYAGKEAGYRKWSELYIALVSQLRAKYEDVFVNEKMLEASSFGLVMVAFEEMKANFSMPRSIGGGMYVEGNCSATQFLKNIRFFLELCNVDFSSVVIQYTRNIPQVALEDNQNAPQLSDKSHSRFSRELMSTTEMILVANFGNGMRKNAAIAKRKFRKFYLKFTGETLSESVDIDELVSAVSFEYAGKFYVISEANKQKLQKLVLAVVSDGNRVIFYEELYQRHLDLMTQTGIFSSEMLSAVLRQILPDMRYSRIFFTPTDDDTLEQDIIHCFGDASMRTYDEIKECLLYADITQIRQVCSYSSQLVWADDETYALTDRIRFSKSDIDRALDTISQDIERQGFSVFQRIDVSESMEWNTDVPEAAVREALYVKHLSSLYTKNRSIITLPGVPLTAPMIMMEHCKSLRETTLSDLQAYEEELTDRTTYSLYAAYETMIRVDRDRFVNPDTIDFNIHAIDAALSLFVQDKIIPLVSVKSFTSFPEVDGYPWNLFLLDSFCRYKSLQFRTMGGPAKSRPVGAIFPVRMGFERYDDLLAQVAAESGLALYADVVAEFFTKNAYTLRRIETGEIISKAQEIRLQEGIADV